jgi:7-cyano-7-deazaguanine synthase in queuosine biosynthesis
MRAVVYEKERPDYAGDPVDLWLQIGKNLRTGETDFVKHFGQTTSLERDLLVLASSIFACDVATKRGMREDITRDIELTIPVVNFQAFQSRRKELQSILYFLSHDRWSIGFERVPGEQEPMKDWPASAGKTLLFSGGLDSLSCAVDLLDELGTANVQLASHVTGNPVTITCQKNLHQYLEGRYCGSIQRVSIRTGGRNVPELQYPTAELEVTQRTRSFTFLTIGVLAARRCGMSEVVVIAENGQMAIHLPLSGARVGAFSTHTAHPEFLSKAREFFPAVLQYPVKIENPYLYKTKAQVVQKLALDHQASIPLSISCWKSARVHGHCGQCIPCYVRRIALEFDGVKADKWTPDMFTADVGNLPFDHEGKRNLTELAEFIRNFRTLSDAELDLDYCELYNDFFERDQAAAMYRCFATEAYTVLARYPQMARLL